MNVGRRDALKMIAGGGLVACTSSSSSQRAASTAPVVVSLTELPVAPTPWPVPDPFLFCVHHDDAYPQGNDVLGPATSLAGREMGSDFAGIDGWRMYHGERVPGFPMHPHRGFETVTVVRRGLLDHSDSLGKTARYGQGDVQWLTAGAGIQHAEMFPLIEASAPNPVELFQIWLNLPSARKFAKPHFSMLWADAIPKRTLRDASGRSVEVTVVAGLLGDAIPAPPPPESWAAYPENDVAIWNAKLTPRATWTLPPARPGTNRWLYFFAGDTLTIDGQSIPANHVAELRPDATAVITGGAVPTEVLVLQGKPIAEPIVKHGPFVMNSKSEIQQAIRDYQVTSFGGWRWDSPEPVHARDAGRFALIDSNKIERPRGA